MIIPMKRFLSLLFTYFVCVNLAFAIEYEPKTVPNPRIFDAHAYVANPDGILTPAEVVQIQQTAAKIDSLSEVELCVVVLNDIGDYDAYDFAFELANLWGIGKREKNNGVLLFLTTGSRRVQIVTGKGIEGIMTDGQCSMTIDEMIDDLHADRFGPAMVKGAKSIGRKVTTTDALAELLFGTHYEEPSEAPWSFFSFLMALFGIGYTGSYYLKRKCSRCGNRTIKLKSNVVVRKATYKQSGLGVKYYVCTTCGEEWVENYTIPRLVAQSASSAPFISGGFGGHGGGGGFSGGSFGGGSFGGGGAGRGF